MAGDGAAADAAPDPRLHAVSSERAIIEGGAAAQGEAPEAERTGPARGGLERDLPFDSLQEPDAAPGPSVATDFGAEVQAPTPGPHANDSRAEVGAPAPAPSGSGSGTEVRSATYGATASGGEVPEGAAADRAVPEERASALGRPATAAPGPQQDQTPAAPPGGLSAWLAALNPAQREAATHTEGPLAIVAGPGTGKTRTLTVRIAHLIQELGVAPGSILALTFTNKAAEELRERLGELLGAEQAARITAGTFHQLGADLLREFAAAAGIPRTFAVFDEADRRLLLRQCCPELSVGELRATLAAISAQKNGFASPAEDGRPGSPELSEIRTRYDAALTEAGALDLDDLVVRSVHLLERDLAVRRTLQARFRWISVDEYQDVNAAQYRLLRLLAGSGVNLCVIGDPDQAIYGFRGADHRYFLAFGDDFPGARRLHLDRNYRSAQGILNAAGQVIAHNPDHQATALTADFAAQVKLEVYRAPTDRAEAEYVVHQVERLVGGTSYFSLDSGRVEDDGLTETHTFGDFAVLYRLNAQAKLLEEAFDRSGIPYQTTGGSAPAEQPPVREILSLLWLTQVPASRLHWWRLLARGPGAARESALEELVAWISGAADSIGGNAALEPYRAAILSPPEARAAHTLELVRSLSAAGQASVSKLVGTAAAGWAELRGRAYDAAELERVARLERRADGAGTGMREFLTAAALQSETDRYDERADRVALMSLHAAKGLEFPVVFITGCEEGMLPYLPPNRTADPAEERRLFYVGMTRARRRLILTHAARRLLFGNTVENPLSGFVTDIESALRELCQPPRRPARPSADDLQLPLF